VYQLDLISLAFIVFLAYSDNDSELDDYVWEDVDDEDEWNSPNDELLSERKEGYFLVHFMTVTCYVYCYTYVVNRMRSKSSIHVIGDMCGIICVCCL